jgi:pSer/pThr/pTyr-binding forkhead associated (FHA) protein
VNRLVIADDEGRTTVVPLLLDEVTVGRKEGNTIRLTERNVSRRHARLYRANGALKIEDLGSANGTKLNGVRLRGQLPVKVGDQIQIGDYRILLEADEAADATVPDGMPAPGASVAPAPAPIARLILLGPPEAGKEYLLDKDEVLIGRSDGCQVMIEHPSLSREHAKVVRADGAFRIVDLESHNGIRVNDQDVPVADLRPGDIVELGHVRARYVAPGEDWMFIPEPAYAPEPEARKGPMVALAGALGVLVVGGLAVWALSGGDDHRTTAAPIASTPAPAVETTAPATAALDPAIALERARGAIGLEDWAAARTSLAEAAARDPSNATVRELLRKVEINIASQPHFTLGMALLAANDRGGAYGEFSQIDVESDYRGKPEVAESVRAFCAAKVVDARRALARRRNAEAREAAEAVIAIPDAPNRERDAAQGILDRLAGPAVAKVGEVMGPAPATGRPEPETDAPAAGGGMAVARECLGRGDQQCVIDALRNPHNEREFELLAATLAQTGQSGRAAQTYCSAAARYPGSGRRDSWISQASRLGRNCPR